MNSGARALVAKLLPPYGARARADGLVRDSGLPEQRAWGELAILCCEGIATVTNGWVTRGRELVDRPTEIRTSARAYVNPSAAACEPGKDR